MSKVHLGILLFFCLFVPNLMARVPNSTYPFGYKYSGERIALSNFQISPSSKSDSANSVLKISDGKCSHERSYYFNWDTQNPRPITLEADLDGMGKRLDQIVIEQQWASSLGLIKQVEIWVMTTNSYRKLTDATLMDTGGRFFLYLKEPIVNPKKIKLIIRGSESNYGPRIYLGDLVCLMLNVPVKNSLAHFTNLFEDERGIRLKPNVAFEKENDLQWPIFSKVMESFQDNPSNANQLISIAPTKQNPLKRSSDTNTTKIVLEEGDHLVFLGKTNSAIALDLFNPITNEVVDTFNLDVGANILHANRPGIVRVIWRNTHRKKPISLNFPTGLYLNI